MLRDSAQLFLALIAIFGMLQTGCGKFFTNSSGSGGGGNSSNTFVYAAASEGVVAFKEDQSSGALTVLTNAAFITSGSTPAAMTIDPQNRFLYVGTSAGVNGFNINSDGTLSPISLSSAGQGLAPVGLVISPSGNTLYVFEDNFNTLSAFSISSGGGLTPISNATLTVAGTPAGLAIDPSGAHLYAAEGTAGILVVAINTDSAGNITFSPASAPVAPSAIAGSFTDPVITPSGKNLYAIANGGIAIFSIDSSGQLTAVNNGAVVSTGGIPSTLSIDSGGSFLFAANNSQSNIASFGILNNGSLTAVTGSPFAAGVGPTGIAVDPKVKFVFVSSSQGVQTFALDASVTGKLDAKGTVNAGTNPQLVVSTH